MLNGPFRLQRDSYRLCKVVGSLTNIQGKATEVKNHAPRFNTSYGITGRFNGHDTNDTDMKRQQRHRCALMDDGLCIGVDKLSVSVIFFNDPFDGACSRAFPV